MTSSISGPIDVLPLLFTDDQTIEQAVCEGTALAELAYLMQPLTLRPVTAPFPDVDLETIRVGVVVRPSAGRSDEGETTFDWIWRPGSYYGFTTKPLAVEAGARDSSQLRVAERPIPVTITEEVAAPCRPR